MIRRTDRPGYALIAVMIVVVVLSLAAYRFADSMTSKYADAVRTTELAQAKAFAASGIAYTAAALADPDTMDGTLDNDPFDNEAFFSNIPVGESEGGRKGGRFSIIAVGDAGSGAGEVRYTPRYGVTDEGGKLNINALIASDKTGEVLYSALMLLPNMTADVADAIVDYVDSDDTPRASGAESSYYGGLATPYRAKNAPLSSVEELLFVRGVTPQLLFGNDKNRNGKRDSGEDDGGDFSRGWSEYLTVYGRELDVDAFGNPRVNLNDQDADPNDTYQTLIAALGQEMADYVMGAKLFGTAAIATATLATGTSGTSTAAKTTASTAAKTPTTSSSSSTSTAAKTTTTATVKLSTTNSDAKATTTTAPTTKVGTAADLTAAVQAALAAGTKPSKNVKSALGLANTTITLPKAAMAPDDAPTLIVSSPLNDPAKQKQYLPALLEYTTTRTTYEIVPRINVNTAPLEVLTAIPGITPADVDAILAARANLDPNDPATLTGAWLVSTANVSLAKFTNLEKYVTGRTMTYRIHSVGYFGQGGPVARMEAVVDTNLGHPRILYFRDLSELSKGFDLPR